MISMHHRAKYLRQGSYRPDTPLHITEQLRYKYRPKQEGLTVASIARDDPSTLPGDDPFPRAY